MSREIVEAWKSEALTFTHDGVTVELLALPSLLADGTLSVYIKGAKEGEKDLWIDPSGHYAWSGLPSKYYDGTMELNGKIYVPHWTHNPLLALRSAIVGVLRGTQPQGGEE